MTSKVISFLLLSLQHISIDLDVEQKKEVKICVFFQEMLARKQNFNTRVGITPCQQMDNDCLKFFGETFALWLNVTRQILKYLLKSYQIS